MNATKINYSQLCEEKIADLKAQITAMKTNESISKNTRGTQLYKLGRERRVLHLINSLITQVGDKVKFDEDDEKIYKREQLRLKMSLDAAKKDGCDEFIVITHSPPTNDKLEASGFTEIYEEYKVKKVIYGHLHGREFFDMGLKGERNGVEYTLASSDYINFKPIKIIE